jgi:hypothetical protein
MDFKELWFFDCNGRWHSGLFECKVTENSVIK